MSLCVVIIDYWIYASSFKKKRYSRRNIFFILLFTILPLYYSIVLFLDVGSYYLFVGVSRLLTSLILGVFWFESWSSMAQILETIQDGNNHRITPGHNSNTMTQPLSRAMLNVMRKPDISSVGEPVVASVVLLKYWQFFFIVGLAALIQLATGILEIKKTDYTWIVDKETLIPPTQIALKVVHILANLIAFSWFSQKKKIKGETSKNQNSSNLTTVSPNLNTTVVSNRSEVGS